MLDKIKNLRVEVQAGPLDEEAGAISSGAFRPFATGPNP